MLELPLPSRRFSILITAFEEALREGFSSAFEPPEFEAIFALTSAEAIDIALEREVDLLIADLDFGSMTGLGIIRVVHERAPSIPSILLGIGLSKEDRLEALANDVRTVIPKPPNYILLRMVARQILERRYTL